MLVVLGCGITFHHVSAEREDGSAGLSNKQLKKMTRKPKDWNSLTRIQLVEALEYRGVHIPSEVDRHDKAQLIEFAKKNWHIPPTNELIDSQAATQYWSETMKKALQPKVQEQAEKMK